MHRLSLRDVKIMSCKAVGSRHSQQAFVDIPADFATVTPDVAEAPVVAVVIVSASSTGASLPAALIADSASSTEVSLSAALISDSVAGIAVVASSNPGAEGGKQH